MRSSLSIMALLILLAIVPLRASAAARRLDMNFEGQLNSAVEEIREKMAADPELKGRKLQLGKFDGPNLPGSNFGLQFERRFEKLAEPMLDEVSDFLVRGEYDFVAGLSPENEGLRVIQFVIKIIDRQRRTLHSVLREVNDTGDIGRILGQTIAPPDTKRIEQRNAKALEVFEQPSFGLRGGSQVTAVGNDDYAVEIRRYAGGSGPAIPLSPTSVRGQAFVDIGVDDTFDIALLNYGTRSDAVARITIDGLDVVREFCEDEATYSGYLTPRVKGTRPGTHIVPGWLKTTQREKDNVFRFVINALGKGAATARNSRGRRGVITVQFFEAVPPDEDLPARSFGEVGRGQPMSVEYTTKPVKLRSTPIVTISIRYSNHPE